MASALSVAFSSCSCSAPTAASVASSSARDCSTCREATFLVHLLFIRIFRGPLIISLYIHI